MTNFSNTKELTVIISTFNPSVIRLIETLNGLKKQSLSLTRWELIIIDNNSSLNFVNEIDLGWHTSFKIFNESKQGLTYARIKGFSEAVGKIIVLVDDDNVLDKNYLNELIEIFSKYAKIGAIGGKSIPIFEHEQPIWLTEFYGNLALRNLGDNIIIEEWENRYPSNAPIGAGMAIRKEALQSYINKITSGKRIIPDRSGKNLSSGGDNDIVLEILKSGWQTGYFPDLVLYHIIPRERLSAKYLAKLLYHSNQSWVQLLDSHHINPWPKIALWTVKFRMIRAWFTYKAWLNDVNYIRWQGACGIFNGLSKK